MTGPDQVPRDLDAGINDPRAIPTAHFMYGFLRGFSEDIRNLGHLVGVNIDHQGISAHFGELPKVYGGLWRGIVYGVHHPNEVWREVVEDNLKPETWKHDPALAFGETFGGIAFTAATILFGEFGAAAKEAKAADAAAAAAEKADTAAERAMKLMERLNHEKPGVGDFTGVPNNWHELAAKGYGAADKLREYSEESKGSGFAPGSTQLIDNAPHPFSLRAEVNVFDPQAGDHATPGATRMLQGHAEQDVFRTGIEQAVLRTGIEQDVLRTGIEQDVLRTGIEQDALRTGIEKDVPGAPHQTREDLSWQLAEKAVHAQLYAGQDPPPPQGLHAEQGVLTPEMVQQGLAQQTPVPSEDQQTPGPPASSESMPWQLTEKVVHAQLYTGQDPPPGNSQGEAQVPPSQGDAAPQGAPADPPPSAEGSTSQQSTGTVSGQVIVGSGQPAGSAPQALSATQEVLTPETVQQGLAQQAGSSDSATPASITDREQPAAPAPVGDQASVQAVDGQPSTAPAADTQPSVVPASDSQPTASPVPEGSSQQTEQVVTGAMVPPQALSATQDVLTPEMEQQGLAQQAASSGSQPPTLSPRDAQAAAAAPVGQQPAATVPGSQPSVVPASDSQPTASPAPEGSSQQTEQVVTGAIVPGSTPPPASVADGGQAAAPVPDGQQSRVLNPTAPPVPEGLKAQGVLDPTAPPAAAPDPAAAPTPAAKETVSGVKLDSPSPVGLQAEQGVLDPTAPAAAAPVPAVAPVVDPALVSVPATQEVVSGVKLDSPSPVGLQAERGVLGPTAPPAAPPDPTTGMTDWLVPGAQNSPLFGDGSPGDGSSGGETQANPEATGATSLTFTSGSTTGHSETDPTSITSSSMASAGDAAPVTTPGTIDWLVPGAETSSLFSDGSPSGSSAEQTGLADQPVYQDTQGRQLFTLDPATGLPQVIDSPEAAGQTPIDIGQVDPNLISDQFKNAATGEAGATPNADGPAAFPPAGGEPAGAPSADGTSSSGSPDPSGEAQAADTNSGQADDPLSGTRAPRSAGSSASESTTSAASVSLGTSAAAVSSLDAITNVQIDEGTFSQAASGQSNDTFIASENPATSGGSVASQDAGVGATGDMSSGGGSSLGGGGDPNAGGSTDANASGTSTDPNPGGNSGDPNAGGGGGTDPTAGGSTTDPNAGGGGDVAPPVDSSPPPESSPPPIESSPPPSDSSGG